MKKTLLEIVQSVLNSMDSDSVNSIHDTTESSQVTQVAEEVYNELMSYNDWDHLYHWMPLIGLSDNSFPNFLRVPEKVAKVDVLRYEVTTPEDRGLKFCEPKYLTPKEFIQKVQSRDSSLPNTVVVYNHHNVPMIIINDAAPSYWTSFDDKNIVTDSWDSLVDSTLQSSKSSAWCRRTPTWTPSDTFVPDLPDEFFPAYIAEVKSVCHSYFKQQLSQKDEQKARRGLAHARRKDRFDRGSTRVKYGR